MARKPEKNNEVQTNREELTVGLGKGKVKGRKRTISYKNVLDLTKRKNVEQNLSLCIQDNANSFFGKDFQSKAATILYLLSTRLSTPLHVCLDNPVSVHNMCKRYNIVMMYIQYIQYSNDVYTTYTVYTVMMPGSGM